MYESDITYRDGEMSGSHFLLSASLTSSILFLEV